MPPRCTTATEADTGHESTSAHAAPSDDISGRRANEFCYAKCQVDTLTAVQDSLLVYLISYAVLGARWIRIAKDHGTDLWCSYAYARAVLVHLFFVTLTPFATKVVGNYGDLWPAVCLYAAITICAALSFSHAANLLAAHEKTVRSAQERFDLTVLIATALLSCAIAFVAPAYSMYAYLLNVVTPFVHRLWRRA